MIVAHNIQLNNKAKVGDGIIRIAMGTVGWEKKLLRSQVRCFYDEPGVGWLGSVKD
jgi:hypothetical protein